MTNDHWPPEGTRVRTKTFHGDFDGVLKGRNNEMKDGDYLWVHFGAGIKFPVERHEIEVIDE